MTTSNAIAFTSPTMRMVQGNPFEKQTKDQMGNLLTVKTGPNAGQPTQRYFCAGAIRKDDPAWPAFFQVLQNAAMQGFPTLFDPRTGACLSREFSWKIADGDDTTVSKPGDIPNVQKVGFAGHWIVKFSSSFEPEVYYAGRYAKQDRVTDARALPRGYFIRVNGSVQPNGNAQKPGLYVNLSLVEIAGVGEIISTGPDAGAAFGGQAAQLPQGAQPLPMHAGNAQPMAGFQPPQQQFAHPGTPMPTQQQFAPPGGQPSAMPTFAPPAGASMTPGAAPGAGFSPPGLAVHPHPNILAGPGMTSPPGMQQPQPGFAPPGGAPQFAPPAGGPQFAPPGGMTQAPQQQQFAPPPMQQAPAVPQMTPKANGWTYEQLRQQGYTDDALRQQGLML